MLASTHYFSQALVLLLVVSLGTVQSQSATCIVEEPHITLGDSFQLDRSSPSSHLFTVGFTIKGECNPTPSVVLSGNNIQELVLSSFERKDINLTISNSEYKKSGLFFKINTEHVQQGYSDWEIRVAGTLVHSKEKIPKKAISDDANIKLFVIADMDSTTTANPTWTKLDQITSTEYDMVMHIGDFAYEIYDNGGKFGDEYFARSSKSSRRIPFVMTPGNHENYANGTLLNYRFRMPTPRDASNAMFDFVYKGVYFMFVTLDWVLSYDPWKNIEHLSRERELLQWIDSRVKILNTRSDIKWRVFGSHRPFDCSDQTSSDCQTNMLFFRRIADKVAQSGFHISLNAHLHSYVRNKLYHGMVPQPLTKLGKGAFMTVINGHAGTAYYFQKEADKPMLMGPLTEVVDVSGPSFLDLRLTAEAVVGRLTRSDTAEVKDTFSITQDAINPKPIGLPTQNSSSSVFLWIALSAVLLIALSLFLWHKRSVADSASSKSYSQAGENEPSDSRISI